MSAGPEDRAAKLAATGSRGAGAAGVQARLWSLLVGIPAIVVATLWGLYAWSVHVDERLLADLRATHRSLAPGTPWWTLRVPREGELRICLYRDGADAPCLCVTEPGGDTARQWELVAADREAVARTLDAARGRVAGCERLLVSTRRFVRYQRFEARLERGRVGEVSAIYPGAR